MCATSLFVLLAEEDRKGFGSSAHLGIFMYLKTALGLRHKIGRCIFVCFAVPFISPSFGCESAMATTFEIGRKQCKKNDLLDFVLHVSCIFEVLCTSMYTCNILQGMCDHLIYKC